MVGRLREEFDKGHTLAAAARILGLEDDLAAANDEIADLQGRLSRADETDGEE